jgi:hypothetical protein
MAVTKKFKKQGESKNNFTTFPSAFVNKIILKGNFINLKKMDQPEEILEKLERFNVQKNPEITRELDEYVSFVARTGKYQTLFFRHF